MNNAELSEVFLNLIVLEFGRVIQSPYYARAIEIAQCMDKYQKIGEGRNEKHFVALIEQEGEQWIELFNIVRNWKSSRVHYKDLNESLKYTGGIFNCYIRRSKSEDNEHYCLIDNWIGCQLIREGHSLELFCKVGRFINKMEFEPDKESIKKIISAGNRKYGLCPAFDIERLERKINELP